MSRWLLTLALLAAGCGGTPPTVQPIALESVPENVMKVAREKLPDVKWERARRKPNGEYEVIGKTKAGKVREIDITPDGKVTEIE